jgi:hypothetical protein
MKILFCSDPLNARKPDPMYEREVAAVDRLGISWGLINYEVLTDENDPSRAVLRLETNDVVGLAVYRGWMMTPDAYARLYDALLQKGWRLINDPAAYRHCHYLPENYPQIQHCTPKTVWLETTQVPSPRQLEELLRPFGDAPIILKDFVKSRKYEWNEACYIPSAADTPAAEKVVQRFMELQGVHLNRGLVFREFVELEPVAKQLARRPSDAMPLVREYRIFFCNGEPVFSTPYWEEGDYGGETAPLGLFREVGETIRSRFFTMDVARRTNGDWTIVELGDGQVAGLPERVDPQEFYRALRESILRQ